MVDVQRLKFCFCGDTSKAMSKEIFNAKSAMCFIKLDSSPLKSIYRMQFVYSPKLLKRFFAQCYII